MTSNFSQALREWATSTLQDPPLTVGMGDDAYDYSFPGETDPDDLYLEWQEVTSSVLCLVSPRQEVELTDHLVDSLGEMVFGSNLVERAGAGQEVTLQLCRSVFEGDDVADELEEGDVNCGPIREFLQAKGRASDHKAVVQSYREIVQHAQAAQYIIQQVCFDRKDMSEAVILETHRILTRGIATEQGTSPAEYSGTYRQCSVMTGFHAYPLPATVPLAMKKMIASLDADISAATSKHTIDPVALAAKHCHAFVNIHPFEDGNGRVCRLVLNALLLRYAGWPVAFIGRDEEERDEYLRVASDGAVEEGGGDGQDDMEGVAEGLRPRYYRQLASLTLRYIVVGMRELQEVLSENRG